MSDAAARERALAGARVDEIMDEFYARIDLDGHTPQTAAREMARALAREQERTRRLEEALRAADSYLMDPAGNPYDAINFAHRVVRAALDSAEAAGQGSAGERTPRETGTVTPAPGLEP